MKKLVLVFGLISCLTSCTKDDDVCECNKNVYLKGTLQQSEFYSNDYNDNNKVFFDNGVQMVIVECK